MSIKPIFTSLQKLIMIHDRLLELSKQKTEAIKQNRIENLQRIMIEERKKIQQLEQTEAERRENVQAWFEKYQPTISEHTIISILRCLDNDKEKQELKQLTDALTEQLTQLRQQEQLNQTLTKQALHFVRFSLDMLNPTITNINYGNQEEPNIEKRSVFDSKA